MAGFHHGNFSSPAAKQRAATFIAVIMNTNPLAQSHERAQARHYQRVLILHARLRQTPTLQFHHFCICIKEC
eukprot:2201711-Karenia_brevis.AAC.1